MQKIWCHGCFIQNLKVYNDKQSNSYIKMYQVYTGLIAILHINI